MVKTYDEYEVDQIAKGKKQTDTYSTERKAQADSSVQTSNQIYDAAIANAEKDYTASAQETEESYRSVYDANAVDELVARRNTEEAMANMGLANSGLNATQQTAISLQRGRADSQTTRQKQAAVDAIMRELDTVRAQYEAEKTAAAGDIYAQADADILNFKNNAETAARQNAASLYAADQEAEAARYAAEQEAATKQAEMLLDAQKNSSDEAVAMLKLGYEWSDEAGGYVKTTPIADTTGQLTNDQIKLALDYMDKTGADYDEAVKALFGSTATTNLLNGYNSLYDALKDYYVNGNTTGKPVNESEQNKNAVRNSILTPGEARYSGEVGPLAMHMTYEQYVNSSLKSAIAEGKITAEEAAEIAIEIETQHGVDLNPDK